MRRQRTAATMAICLTLLLTGTAQAARESWYSYWGVGYANNSYYSELESTIDAARDAAYDHIAFSCDILGVYRPLSDTSKTLVGVVMNGTVDAYDLDSDWIQANNLLVSISSMHFFGSEPGKGFFIRGDAGYALTGITSDREESVNYSGYGVLVGGGYGIPISKGTRILLNINYAYRTMIDDDAEVGSFCVGIGGLF